MKAMPPKGSPTHPKAWRRDRLKDVSAINRRSLGVSTDPNVELDYLEISNVNSLGIVDRSKIEHFRFADAPSRARRCLAEGATIISSVRPNLQAIAFIDETDSNLICSTGFNVVEPIRHKLEPRYLYYYLLSDDAKQYFVATAKGVGYPAIDDKEFSTVEVPLPPLPEQKRIAAFLDAKCTDIDKAIAAKRKQQDSIEAIWSNVLHRATLQGIDGAKLKPTNNAIVKKIPVGWTFKRLRYIGRCQNGISKAGQYFGYGYPFLPYGDVYNNIALPEVASGLIDSTPEERECYSVERGDIFFTRTSETADEVGFSSVCLKTIPDATFAGFVIRVRPVTDDLLPEFSQYYFRNPFVSQHFAKEMMVVTRASLSQGILKSLPVLIPPRDEQKRIIEYLDAKRKNLDELKDNLRRQIEVLEQYRKSLIHECVTGKRRIEE